MGNAYDQPREYDPHATMDERISYLHQEVSALIGHRLAHNGEEIRKAAANISRGAMLLAIHPRSSLYRDYEMKSRLDILTDSLVSLLSAPGSPRRGALTDAEILKNLRTALDDLCFFFGERKLEGDEGERIDAYVEGHERGVL